MLADSPRLARRGFLARLSAAGAAALLTAPRPLAAALPAAGAAPDDPDAWIERVRGRDRLVVHAHQHLLPALAAAHGVRADGQRSYGVPESESGVAVATHGPAIGGLFTDAAWQRHALGERYGLKAPGGGWVATNPFLRPQEGAAPEATIPALMERGVVFLVCNVALRNLSRRLVAPGERAEPLQEELAAGLLPGVFVVPNVFVAISHGQQRGMSYLFID
jgi:hypothetical protein